LIGKTRRAERLESIFGVCTDSSSSLQGQEREQTILNTPESQMRLEGKLSLTLERELSTKKPLAPVRISAAG
jgi:hypothetical protein